MLRSPVQTFAAYLAGVPAKRRASLKAVRSLVKKHLPKGYRETVRQRMILYEVPLKIYPDTYNGEPLCYAALASEKNYLSLHLMAAYASPQWTLRLREGFKAAGKKLDMGKACIRFRNVDDLPLDVIGEVVASTPMAGYVAMARAVRRR